MAQGALQGHRMVSMDAAASVQCHRLSPCSVELAWGQVAHLPRGQGASQNKSNPDPGPRASDLQHH